MVVGLATGIVGVLGEPAIITVAGIPYNLMAVFREPYVGMTVAGVLVERPDPSVLFSVVDYGITGAKSGDTVMIRGITYIIVAAETREDGVSVVLRG